MTRQFLLGTAAALLIAVPASALTMTPITDGRTIDAFGAAGQATDSDDDSPGPGFPSFDSTVNAFAIEFSDFGAGAGAIARQTSQLGPLSISGSGSTDAFGGGGEVPQMVTLGDVDEQPPPLGFGEFQAGGNSVLEILFHIDEAASFNLEGFLSAGFQKAPGFGDANSQSGVESVASVILHNEDTNTPVYKQEVSDGGFNFAEAGVIQAGNYVFTLRAFAGVLGGLFETLTLGDSDGGSVGSVGSETTASFQGSLVLSPTDRPIPEPVTTSLIGMGLGALALQTSRRRRA